MDEFAQFILQQIQNGLSDSRIDDAGAVAGCKKTCVRVVYLSRSEYSQPIGVMVEAVGFASRDGYAFSASCNDAASASFFSELMGFCFSFEVVSLVVARS